MPGFVQKLQQLHSQKPGNSSNGAQTTSSLINMEVSELFIRGTDLSHVEFRKSELSQSDSVAVTAGCLCGWWIISPPHDPECRCEPPGVPQKCSSGCLGSPVKGGADRAAGGVGVLHPAAVTSSLLVFIFSLCHSSTSFPFPLHLPALSLSYAHILPPVLFLTSLDRVSVVCIYL